MTFFILLYKYLILSYNLSSVQCPKKGDSSVCENHRGISLIAHVSKVLTLLINTRVTNYVEHQQILPEAQSGFRKNRSTSDMILTVKLLQQNCRTNTGHYFWSFWILQRHMTQQVQTHCGRCSVQLATPLKHYFLSNFFMGTLDTK